MFINLLITDEQSVTLNINDIGLVKSFRVRPDKAGKQAPVDGCIIDLISSEYSVWCIEPRSVILERIASFAKIEGPKEWTP